MNLHQKCCDEKATSGRVGGLFCLYFKGAFKKKTSIMVHICNISGDKDDK